MKLFNGFFGGGEAQKVAEENPRQNMERLGKGVIASLEQEPQGGGNLDLVSASIRGLGERNENRTAEVFGRLVRAADLPQETKDQLLQGYQPGDDFSALVDEMRMYAGESRSAGEIARRNELKQGIKKVLTGAVVVGVAAAIFMGVRTYAKNKTPVSETPTVVEETVEAPAEEVVVEPEEEDAEEIEETSLLDVEYKDANFENYDLQAIGEEVKAKYLDTGEGYEKSENGIEANFSDYNAFDEKSSHNAFGRRISDAAVEGLQSGDTSLYIDEAMDTFTNNVPVGIAHVSLIEPAMEALGVPDEIQNIQNYGERAQETWNWVREQGGDKSTEALGALYAAYKAETTSYEVIERTGTDWTMYEMADDGEEIDIANATLMGQSRIERDEAVQVITRMEFTNANDEVIEVEFIDNMACRVQPTGPVVVRNKTTGEETTILPEPEETVEQVQQSTKQTVQNTQQETTSTAQVTEQKPETVDKQETTETVVATTPEEVVTETEVTETIKSKDADNLIQNVTENLQKEHVDNYVTQTESVVPEQTWTDSNTYTYESNDGTTATVQDNAVVSVTDSNGTVEVTSGDTTPVGTVTENPVELHSESSTSSSSNTSTSSAPEQTYSESDYEDAL